MIKYLTADDIANNVRMIRTVYHGAILIVEGSTDVRVYENLINKTQCMLVPAYCKDNAIDALNKLERNNFKGVLTIVDTDFWKLDGIQPNTPNLLLTDTHDLETMILSSKALDKLLAEFGSQSRIALLGKSIRAILLEGALSIGFLRWLSSPTKDNLSLRFKNLNFNNFVDIKKLSVNIDYLINEVKTNSQDSTLDNSMIKSKITALMNAGYDPWQVCSGHDMVQLLSIGLMNIFGNHRAMNIITLEQVDGILRVSYESSFFSSTQLHKAIKNWEITNTGFKVLS